MGVQASQISAGRLRLSAQLDRLDEYSLASKRAITVPLLKQMLAEATP